MDAGSVKAEVGVRAETSELRAPVALCVVALLAVAGLFFGTFSSIVSIWWRSNTFAHGFFIVPISLYLIWTRKEELKCLTPKPDARALVVLALVGMVWLAARLAGVLVVEQYAAVAMIPVVVWAVLGSTLARSMAFPLGFLLLMVPVGEALIPTMIDHTAAFTVAALRFSGVPVLQEGNLLTLPTGSWSVVEACSGLRYLIACVTMGLLFAYLTYRSWWRRGVFIAVSFVVPVIANWLRAYMIVMLGHLSNMRLAAGVDHLIYGWIFYGIIMFLLLWAGSKFSDETGPGEKPTPVVPSETAPPGSRFVLVAAGVLLVAGVWPLWADVASPNGTYSEVALSLPQTVAGWTASHRPLALEPHYVGADAVGGEVYANVSGMVVLHLAYYADQRQGAELVNSANVLVGGRDPVWQMLSTAKRTMPIGSGALDVVESQVAGDTGEVLVWSWYWIDGHRTTNDVWAKVIEAQGRLMGASVPAAGVVLYTQNDDGARARLSAFCSNVLPSLEAELRELHR